MTDPTSVMPNDKRPQPGEKSGDHIGPYRLLQEIGEGGFGVVFEAEQEHPVRRRVALKIIKLGMDTHAVIARFEAERQALALMDHPHIARVLDAGATVTGRPYFVMELVRGEPLTQFADRNKLSITDRLHLFEQVCSAVQHAHTKGIIHRDLKPGNVLVSTQDDKPFARVIDFGIAKATSGRLTDSTLFTRLDEVMGTPRYMSPEQIEGSSDIDTRTDIYSLGVMLYELLTGTTPVQAESLRSASIAEIQRIIREVDPPRPSARVTGSTTKAELATRRRTDPGRLSGLIRGELDWIVMKSLEKERARRYETANGLAMDVRRFIAGEPVLAAPPSTTYRFRKLVGRNKPVFAAAAVVALSLILGVAGFAWQARKAEHQAALAQARADELAAVSKFQGEMLGQIDPLRTGKQLTEQVRTKFADGLKQANVPETDRPAQIAAFAAQWQHVNATDTAMTLIDESILHPAVATIDKQFKNQPIVAASLRQVLADQYRVFGKFDQALPLQQSALDARKKLLGEAHPDTLSSLGAMADLLRKMDRRSEAEPYAREALRLRRQVLGPNSKETLASINTLATILDEQGKLAEAEPYYREALATGRRLLGPDDPFNLTLLNDMGYLLDDEGKEAEAEAYYREALQRERRVIGVESQETLATISNLGSLLAKEGKLQEAEPYFRESLEQGRRAMGDDHPDTLIGINLLGSLLLREGKLDEAERYIREGLERKRRVLGEDHGSTLKSLAVLCRLYQARGQLDQAETCSRDVLQRRTRTVGPNSPDTLVATTALASVRLAQGAYEDTEKILAPLDKVVHEQYVGGNAIWLVSYLTDLGKARIGLRKFSEAEKNLLEARAAMLKLNLPGDKRNSECVSALAALYTEWSKAEPGKGHEAKATEWQALAKQASSASG
jgi:serine/threonine protein kinase/tetratricopeptide (TPR) repeat protein